MIRITSAPGAYLGLGLGPQGLRRLLDRIVAALGLEGSSFGLRLVDDAEIAVLNERFLGCVGPTNVLSFPAEEETGEGDEPFLGDIALSVDTLLRESFLYGQDPGTHLARLLAHALLHLSGMEHGETMYALTDMAVEQATSGD